MRRAKVRFGLLIAAIGLLVFLILFQQALQNGLLTSVRRSACGTSRRRCSCTRSTARRTLQGSIITPELEAQVRAARRRRRRPGYIGQGTFTVTAGGEIADAVDHRLRDARALGSPSDADRRAGSPRRRARPWPARRTPTTGSTSATRSPSSPGGLELTVVGLASDAQLSVGPTMFVTYDTYLDAIAAREPRRRRPAARTRSACRPADGHDGGRAWWRRSTPQSDDLDALDPRRRPPTRRRASPRCASRSR